MVFEIYLDNGTLDPLFSKVSLARLHVSGTVTPSWSPSFSPIRIEGNFKGFQDEHQRC